MKTALRLSCLVPAAALLLLAACTGDAPAEETGGSASGEILSGSISDGMIASDSLQSQPPLMEEERATGSAGGGTADAGDDAGGEGDGEGEDASAVEEATEE